MGIALGKDGVSERPEVPVRTLHVVHVSIGSDADLELRSRLERDGPLAPRQTQEVAPLVVCRLRIVFLKLGQHLTHTDASIHGFIRDGDAIVGKNEVLHLHTQKARIARALLPAVEVLYELCAILRGEV